MRQLDGKVNGSQDLEYLLTDGGNSILYKDQNAATLETFISNTNIGLVQDVTLDTGGLATVVTDDGGLGQFGNFDLSSHLTAQVPEPGAAAVLAGALAAAFVLRRRGRRG